MSPQNNVWTMRYKPYNAFLRYEPYDTQSIQCRTSSDFTFVL